MVEFFDCLVIVGSEVLFSMATEDRLQCVVFIVFWLWESVVGLVVVGLEVGTWTRIVFSFGKLTRSVDCVGVDCEVSSEEVIMLIIVVGTCVFTDSRVLEVCDDETLFCGLVGNVIFRIRLVVVS